MKLIVLLVFLLGAVVASASTIVAISASQSDVQTAINSAVSGDTVQIPAGSATWATYIDISGKSITLQGVGSVNLTGTVGQPDMIRLSPSTASLLCRVTNINFLWSTSATAARCVNIYNACTNFQIDHCTFLNAAYAVFVSNNSTSSKGVICDNSFTNCDINIGINGSNNYTWDNESIVAGTSNAIFIERNTFTENNSVPSKPRDWIQHQFGARSVIRYNTFDGSAMTSYVSNIIDSHGNQNGYYTTTSLGNMRGQPLIEMYSNTISFYTTDRLMYIRGGSMIFYSNVITSTGGSVGRWIQLTEQESWDTSAGAGFAVGVGGPGLRTLWPAEDQVTNSFFDTTNTFNGTALSSVNYATYVDIDSSNPSVATFIQKDRDFFIGMPAASGGKSSYTSRIGAAGTAPTDGIVSPVTYPNTGTMTFSSSGANAYYPYTAYTYPYPGTGGGGGGGSSTSGKVTVTGKATIK